MRKQRGDKQNGIEDTVDTVDYISNLPEFILLHILSFVPTNEAVKTSVLSPRWKNLWASVPNLDVDATEDYEFNENPPKLTSFMNFLERVFHPRSESNIKKIRLTCSMRNDESQIGSWITDAIKHNLEELELDIYQGVPWSILDTTSLVILKIETSYLGELPACFSLPCLKSLQLRLLMLLKDGKVEKLLLGCPVVEELVLLDLSIALMNIVISNSTLKRLIMHDMVTCGGIGFSTGCKMKIDAPNLTYFEYSGFLPNEIILNNASSLVKACINSLPNDKQSQNLVAHGAVNLLKQLQSVVSLSVSETTIKYLMLADTTGDQFPKFENLSHLMLLTSERLGHKTFGAVIDFLHLCPILQSICLSEGFICLGEDDSIWSPLPKCISNCIKTVTLKGFCGNDSEICFLKCILKYACVLERLDIWCSKKYVADLKMKTKVTKELEKTEKRSTACVINFL